MQGGREAGCRPDRRGPFPASEGGQHPEEPVGLQGAEGRTGRHAGSGKLRPLTAAEGQSSPDLKTLLSGKISKVNDICPVEQRLKHPQVSSL